MEDNRNTRKTTVKDVAKAAGVSVATVSYVLNNKPGQKISDETRKKVLQIANLLNYAPRHEAVSLATGKNNMIGITFHLSDDTPSRNLEITHLVNLLAERFNRMGYNVILIPYDREAVKQTPNRLLEGMIAIDLTEKDFRAMANEYYIPIICLDMMTYDFLFYQIYTDMPTLVSKAKQRLGEELYLVMDRYENEKYQEYIAECIPADHMLFFSDCDSAAFQRLSREKVLVMGSYLGLILRQYIPDEHLAVISCHSTAHALADSICQIENDVSRKANLTVNIMLNALERKFDVTHDYRIC